MIEVISREKAIAEEYIQEVWNHKNTDAVHRFVDEHVVIHSMIGDYVGREHMEKVVATWLISFPDLTVTNKAVICERDTVVAQWSAEGTHKGVFKEHPGTGKSISYRGVSIYRIQEEKITEYWAYIDMQHILKQIEG